MKRKLLFLPLLLVALVSCDNEPSNGGSGPQPGTNNNDQTTEVTHVTSVSLNKKQIQLNEGESETLTYTINPANADNKNVAWESSDSIIASVEDGVVTAWNPGTADISVITEDGSKQDKCTVTVSSALPDNKLIKDEFALNEQGYSFSNKSLTNFPLEYGDYKIEFAVGANTSNNQPTLIQATNKRYECRVYWGNTFKITSKTNVLNKIEFDLGENDKNNNFTCSVGTIENGYWVGEAKEITFAVSGFSGYKAFETFRFCYEGETVDDPNILMNLGTKKISEVKQYINKHPVKKNSFGNGVDYKRYVTIKGLAVAKIDLIKSTAAYGLDVSEHGKVILADETGYIGVATTVNNLGTSLWGKLAEHACEETSTYVVTGYLSEYLGNPEILVTAFRWDQTLEINVDFSHISSGVKTLTQFYELSNAVNYNCAGHGYGKVITLKNLSCYYVEADGQGKRYYNFTDGNKNIRVNAFNISGATEGRVYDVTGIISLKDLSPIIIALEIKASTEDFSFPYETCAQDITIAGLKNIHGSQDDTNTKYPEVVNAYGNIYKTTGYMVAVEENGKLYVGISDTARSTVLTGKTNAMANYDVVLIKNENFWNTTEEELFLFNSYYDDYLCEDNPIDIYFVVRQLTYSSKKPMWEILLIPQSIPVIEK